MMNPAFSHNNIKVCIDIIIFFFLIIVELKFKKWLKKKKFFFFFYNLESLKGLIEDKVNKEESKIILTLYISKATFDIIGLIDKKNA